MEKMNKKDDVNFIEAFLQLNKLYKETNDINIVLEKIDKLPLVDRPKNLLKSLFKNAEKDGTSFEESFIKSQTLKSAREYLLSITGIRKEKSFQNESDKGIFNYKIEVVRKGNNIEITGNSLKTISSFLQSELSAKWNNDTQKYVISDVKNKKNIDAIYGKIINKVFYNELRDIKKKEYYEKPNEKTLLVYGRASVLYAGAINREFLEKQIDLLEEKQESGDKSVHQLYNALVGTENAVKELVALGILHEKIESVTPKDNKIKEVTVSRFSSPVAKKILSHNIDAEVKELKALLKASDVKERRRLN
jgi:hypothetical protein